MYIDKQLKHDLRKNFQTALEEKDYTYIYSYLSNTDNYINSIEDTKFITSTYEFLTKNKDNIEFVQSHNALYFNIHEIKDNHNDIIFRFIDSILLIHKPCVIVKSKLDNVYSIYDNNDNIICKIILKEQV